MAPTTTNQNCTCSVTTSAPPIAWKAAASRIGLQRRVRRVRRRREEVLVEAAEEEDRLALRHPERPRVVLPGGSAAARRGTTPRGRAPRARRPPPMTSTVGVPPSGGGRARGVHARSRPATTPDGGENQRASTTIPTPPNGHAGDEQRRPQHAERGEADAGTRAPRAGARRPTCEMRASAQSSERPTTRVGEVQRDEPGERTHRHGGRLRIASLWSSPPRRPARRGRPPGRRRSRGSTARRGPIRRGRRKYRM